MRYETRYAGLACLPYVTSGGPQWNWPEIAIASPDVIATEMARRKLLSAMGISVYSSRFDFPGAAKAKRLSLPMAAVSEPVDRVDRTKRDRWRLQMTRRR